MIFIVLEIQTNADNSVGTLVWKFEDRNVAEQQYHTILAAAAVSALPVHAAVMMTNDGRLIASQSYRHAQEEVNDG